MVMISGIYVCYFFEGHRIDVKKWLGFFSQQHTKIFLYVFVNLNELGNIYG